MSLTNVLILVGLSLAVYVLCLTERTRKFKQSFILIFSILVIFWLQPALSIRGLDFWLPVATLVLTALGWIYTSKPEERERNDSLKSAALIVGIIIIIALTRYFGAVSILTPNRPPQTLTIVLVIICSTLFVFAISRIRKIKNGLLWLVILDLICIFVLLKLPVLTTWLSGVLRGWSGQSRELASALDIRWLGFSYIAFRMIHTLRDRQNGRLPKMTLSEYFIYILFFPAISAGPIDRSERFLKDLRQPFSADSQALVLAGKRLVLGLFKKFVLADLLAMIALNATNALQVHSTGWMWLMLYAYAFQIFFDFSGYTDIAIGLAALMGIHLPENFNHPYLQRNLTQFWNNWHMTLTQWFRGYFFNPLTRTLRSRKRPIAVWLVILITQISTMLLIGLWHGITLNFILWGLWHGLGMFIQNRWSDWVKPLSSKLEEKPVLNRAVTAVSTLITFNFVALGWVWFALPSVELSMRVFSRLFGVGG